MMGVLGYCLHGRGNKYYLLSVARGTWQLWWMMCCKCKEIVFLLRRNKVIRWVSIWISGERDFANIWALFFMSQNIFIQKPWWRQWNWKYQYFYKKLSCSFDGLVQERCNSIANALEFLAVTHYFCFQTCFCTCIATEEWWIWFF